MTRILAFVVTFALLAPALALASPSRIVMVPSSSVVPPWNIRAEMETLVRLSDRKASKGSAVSPGARDPGVTVVGVTGGAGIDFLKLRGEVGVDYVAAGPDVAERNPWTMHWKVVLPELALGKSWQPAVTVGMWNYWPNKEHASNMSYGLLSYNFPVIGRLSAGGYHGDQSALGGVENGILASWDTPFNDHFWAGVDFVGGSNKLGSVNAAVAWAFSKRSSLGIGYNLHTAREYSGADTFLIRGSFLF